MVLCDMYHLPDPQVLPRDLHVGKRLVNFSIALEVTAPAHDIIPGFFGQVEAGAQNEGYYVGDFLTNIEKWNKLRNRDPQEIQVEEDREVIEQADWNKCEPVIASVFHQV